VIQATCRGCDDGAGECDRAGGTATAGRASRHPRADDRELHAASGPVGTASRSGTNLPGQRGALQREAASFTVTPTRRFSDGAGGRNDGPVSVTTPAGRRPADDFTVIPAPTIASFTPKSGSRTASRSRGRTSRGQRGGASNGSAQLSPCVRHGDSARCRRAQRRPGERDTPGGPTRGELHSDPRATIASFTPPNGPSDGLRSPVRTSPGPARCASRERREFTVSRHVFRRLCRRVRRRGR